MKCLVWGTGGYARRVMAMHTTGYFSDKEIMAYIDNNRSKTGMVFLGKPVITPEMIQQYSYEKIVICSSHYKEIVSQLIQDLMVDMDKIVLEEQINAEINAILIQNNLPQKKVLVLGSRERWEAMEWGYKEVFENVFFLELENLDKIADYSFDYILLMNLTDILNADKEKGRAALEEEMIQRLVINYGIERERIFTDVAYFELRKNLKKVVTCGDKNQDKNFLVIRLGGNSGIALFAKCVALNVIYAKSKGWIPVVDMSVKNQYLLDDEVGNINAWEKFFEQPAGYSMEDVKRSKNVYLSFSNRAKKGAFDKYHLSYDFLKMKLELDNQVNEFLDKWFCDNNKILGVLYRGTDYVNVKPFDHPIQPDIDMMIDTVKAKIEEWGGFDKIYLATEVDEAVSRFQKEFGDMVFFYPQKRIASDYQGYIAGAFSNSDRAMVYKKGADYWCVLEALSKCNSIVAGQCTGTEVALSLNDRKYENVFLFDLGYYGY